jgi:regulator of protease activity HflC (stomatin/prohibitin superfamily)|tara:strand:- start:410 stop:571 length:162 start_codon:yes stop_codon:yes gene_type:complete
MTEPKRLPIDPQRTESREDKIKKIPLPSLEKEFYDLISEAERYKEQQKNQSDS